MTEKKTFKNPELTVFQDGSGWKITPPGVTQYSGNHIWLPANEWDMEVTFTKKPKQFQPGDKVNFADETEADWYPFGMTVLAQHKGMAVVYNPADEIEVYDSEILTKI